MALEKKDLRAKVTPRVHSLVTIFADIKDMDIGEYVEQIIEAHVEALATESIIVNARMERAGLTGKERE